MMPLAILDTPSLTAMVILLAKITVVLLLAGVAARAMTRAAASTRVLIRAAALVAVIAVPVVDLAPTLVAHEVPTSDPIERTRVRLTSWAASVPAGSISIEPSSGGLAVRVPHPGAEPGAMSRDANDTSAASDDLAGAAVEEAAGLAAGVSSLAPDGVSEGTDAAAGGAISPVSLSDTWMRGPVSLAVMGAILWTLGALVVIARHALARRHRDRIAADAVPLADPATRTLLDACRAEVGVTREVQLLETDVAVTPMTWALRRPVILLPIEARRWTDERRRAVLVHELAHVRNGDAWMRMAAVVASTLYWFHPLVWTLRSAMERDQELAADDLVLAGGERPSAYAAHLVAIARSLGKEGRASGVAVAMAGSQPLRRRVTAILDGGRRRTPLTVATRIGVVAPLTVVALGLAAQDLSFAAGGRTDERTSGGYALSGDVLGVGELRHVSSISGIITTHEEDGTSTAIVDGGEGTEIASSGEYGLTDDDRDIAWIDPDGFVFIADNSGGRDRVLRFDPARDGELVRTYTVDGRAAAIDDDVRTWRADLLERLVTEAGVGADARLSRILDRDGVSGVLDELDRLPTTHVRAMYLNALLQREPVFTREEERRLVRILARFEHDYQKLESLEMHPAFFDRALETDDATRELLESFRHGVDWTAVMPHVLGDDPTEDGYRLMLQLVSRRTDEYQRGEVLSEVIDEVLDRPSLRPELFEVLDRVPGYARAEVLADALLARRSDPTLVSPVLDLVRRMETHEAVTVIDALVAHVPPGDPEVVGAFLDGVLDLGDHDARPVLRRMVSEARPDDGDLRLRAAALLAARNLEPYARLELLRQVARTCRREARLEATYREVADTLDEEYDRQRAFRAIGDR